MIWYDYFYIFSNYKGQNEDFNQETKGPHSHTRVGLTLEI